VTATSQTARDFAEIFCQELITRSSGIKKSYVLEIASNDGTFLTPFLKRDYKVLGIDPARNIAKVAKDMGIETKTCFFGKKAAQKLRKERGPAQIVFARNVLPHVANTRDFTEGLSLCLKEDGILAIEAHYAKNILEQLHYDSIYHEHLCYFTLKSLEKLLNDFGIFVFDIKESPISGGSVIVYAKLKKGKETAALKIFRKREAKDRVNEFASWKDFAKKSFGHREKLLETLNNLKKKGKIVGYGASARSSTLLNFCQIDSKLISIIADQNPLKQKKFTAGTHILIDSPEVAMKSKPKTIFILAWNFAEEIMENLRSKFNFKGQALIPLPNAPYVKKI
jgi:hypothetical protein